MNTETVLKVWMDENVSVGAIARLFETDIESVEDGIRAELRRLRFEAMEAEPAYVDMGDGKQRKLYTNEIVSKPIPGLRQYQQDVLDQARQAVAKLPGPIDNALFGPIDTDEIKHPRQQKPAAKPAAKSAADVSDLESYPEPLRYPLAVNLRAIWRALSEPRTALQIAEETGIASDTVYNALFTMKTKLVVHKRDADRKWERITEVSK